MGQPTDVVRDQAELAALGYRSELKRTLGGAAMFAASFALISVVVGVFTAYSLGYGLAGPPVVWAVLLVVVAQLLVALVFADLAARFPVSGSVYQWATRLGGRGWGVVTGWTYVAAWLVVVPSIAIGLQATLLAIDPGLHLLGGGTPEAGSLSFAQNAIVLAVLLFGFTTLVNLISVRAVAVASYVGLAAEVLGVLLLLGILVTHIERGPGVLTDSIGLGDGRDLGYFGALLVGAFLPAFIFFGFDSASSLAEETREPRRAGPQAVMRSVAASGVVAVLICALAPMAASDVRSPDFAAGGLQFLVLDVASSTLGTILFVVVAICIVCAAVAAQALTGRMIFSMARDGSLPFSHLLSRVHPRTQTPPLAIAVPGVVWVAIMLVNLSNAKVFNAVIGVGVSLIYVAYLGVTTAALRERRAGRLAPQPGYFSVRGGTVVHVLAVLWGLVASVNLLWPRADFYGTDWYQQYAGILVLAVVVLSGLGVHRLTAGRAGQVLPEHASAATDATDVRPTLAGR